MIPSKASLDGIEDMPRFDLADLEMVHEIGAFDCESFQGLSSLFYCVTNE